jgi:hypothetical protein
MQLRERADPMTAIDREALQTLIDEARTDVSDADRCVALHITPATHQLHRRLREVTAALDTLLALVPEPPTDDEREAMLKILDRVHARQPSWVGTPGRQADAMIAAGFTRRPLPSREQIAKALFEHYRSTHRETYPWSRQSIVTHRMYLSEADAILALFTPGGDS